MDVAYFLTSYEPRKECLFSHQRDRKPKTTADEHSFIMNNTRRGSSHYFGLQRTKQEFL